MTNWHKVRNVLKNSEKMLSVQDIAEKTGLDKKKVYRVVGNMRKRNRLLIDTDFDGTKRKLYNWKK